MSEYGGDPWSLIAQIIGGAATRNANQSAKGARESVLAAQANKYPGMRYQAAPQLDRSGSDTMTPAEVVGNIGDTLMPGSKAMAKAYPAIGQAVQAEKDLYAPGPSVSGGYMVGNGQKVDSSKQAYDSSESPLYYLLQRFRRS